jgi:hypothetical protein
MTTAKPITLVQVIQHYKGQPHQTAALYELEADLKANGYAVAMSRLRPWFNTWQMAPALKQPFLQQNALRAELKVPYFSQMDNPNTAIDGPGWRLCASSSCAMLAAFWDKVSPDVKGEASYITLRQRHGGTTDPMAHVATLRELGLVVEFRTNGTSEHLRQEIIAGRPVAVGWLHHGPVTAPCGGGHWSCVIGYAPGEWIHHDPYGEANLTAGGYSSTGVGAGRSIHYSMKSWVPRWTPKKTDGWMITARPA